MKKLTLSIAAVMAMSTFAIAGGDIAPVEEPMVEVAAPVVDDSGFYIGAAYSYMNWNDNNFVDGGGGSVSIAQVLPKSGELDINGNALTVLAGYNFNKYIAVEGRYSMTLGDVTWEYPDGSEEDDGSEFSNVALYLKPMYPIGGLTLYGLLGYGQVSFDIEGEDEASESGFQWGLGASYAVNDNIGVFVDYIRLYDDEGFDWIEETDIVVDSINFGVTYKF